MAVAAAALDRGAIMTRALRRAHRRVWLVLTVTLYALLIAAITWRHPSPPVNADLHWEEFR